MLVAYKKLELFRDLVISQSELNEFGKIDLFNAKIDNGRRVLICLEHVIRLLNMFRENKVTQIHLLEWVYTVRWTGLFEFCDGYRDSILSVLDKLEETNIGKQIGFDSTRIDILKIVNENKLEEIKIYKKIKYTEIEKYIYALKNNTEL